MANSTAAVPFSTATGFALFGFMELFVQQPNVAVILYGLVAVAQIAPQYLPAYDAAAVKFESIFMKYSATIPTEAATDSVVPTHSASPPSETSATYRDDIDLPYDQHRSLINLSKPSVWFLGSLTWIPLMLFSFHRNYIQDHARRQRYFNLIVGFAYAAVVAYLAASDWPWELLRSLGNSFYMLTSYWRFKLQRFSAAYAEEFSTGWSWVDWNTVQNNKRPMISAVIAILIQTPLLIIVLRTALGNFMYRCIQDPLYMRARIANATYDAIWLPHSLCHMILRLWLAGNGLTGQLLRSWVFVEETLIAINAVVAFGGLFYAQDVLVSLVVQSFIVSSSLCYLYNQHIGRGIFILRDAASRSIVSVWHAVATFVDDVKGWLIFYTLIVWGIKAPVALKLVSRDAYSVRNLWSSIPHISHLIPKPDLHFAKFAVTTPLTSFPNMRHDVVEYFDYACNFVVRVFAWSWTAITTRPTQCANQGYTLFKQAAAYGGGAAIRSKSACCDTLSACGEGVQSVPTQSKLVVLAVLSACSDKLSNCLATISYYSSRIPCFVFHAKFYPRTAPMYWSMITTGTIAAIFTLACVAAYNHYRHPTGRRFIVYYYLALGLGYLFTLDCVHEVGAAVFAALVALLLSYIAAYTQIVDAVTQWFISLVKDEDDVYGDVFQFDQSKYRDVWAAIASEISNEEEDMPEPSSESLSVLSPHDVASEEKLSVQQSKINAKEMQMLEEEGLRQLRKQRYNVERRHQRATVRLERAIAAVYATRAEIKQIGPRPLNDRTVEHSSAPSDEAAEDVTHTLTAAVNDAVEASSVLSDRTTEELDISPPAAADEAAQPSSPPPTETTEEITATSPDKVETGLPAKPLHGDNENDDSLAAASKTELPESPSHETPEHINDSSAAALEAEISERRSEQPGVTIQEEVMTQEGKSAPELTFPLEPVIAAPAPAILLEPVIAAPAPAFPQESLVVASAPESVLEPVIAGPAPVSLLEPVITAPAPASLLEPVIAAPAPASLLEPVIAAPAPASLLEPVIAAPAPASSHVSNVAPALAPVSILKATNPSVSYSPVGVLGGNNLDLSSPEMMLAKARIADGIARRAANRAPTIDDGIRETTTNTSKPEPEDDEMEIFEEVPLNVPAQAEDTVDDGEDTNMNGTAPGSATVEKNGPTAPAQQIIMTENSLPASEPAATSSMDFTADQTDLSQSSSHDTFMPTTHVTQRPLPLFQNLLSSAAPATPTVVAPLVNAPVAPVTQPQPQSTFLSSRSTASQPEPLFGTPNLLPQQWVKPLDVKVDLNFGPATPTFANFGPSPIPVPQTSPVVERQAEPLLFNFNPPLKFRPAVTSIPVVPQTTQDVANLTSAPQPSNDTNADADLSAAVDAVFTNTDNPQESDISSLDSAAARDVSEGERMLANAYAARDAAAAAATAAPPRAQSPIESEEEWEDTLYADPPRGDENVEDELDFFNQTETVRAQSNINNRLSSETVQDSDEDMSNVPGKPLETILECSDDDDLSDVPDKLSDDAMQDISASKDGKRPNWGGGANSSPKTKSSMEYGEWDGTATKHDPAPADRKVMSMPKKRRTPTSATFPNIGNAPSAPLVPAPRAFKYSSPTSPVMPVPVPAPTLPPAPKLSAPLSPAYPSQWADLPRDPKMPTFGAGIRSSVKKSVPYKIPPPPSYYNSTPRYTNSWPSSNNPSNSNQQQMVPTSKAWVEKYGMPKVKPTSPYQTSPLQSPTVTSPAPASTPAPQPTYKLLSERAYVPEEGDTVSDPAGNIFALVLQDNFVDLGFTAANGHTVIWHESYESWYDEDTETCLIDVYTRTQDNGGPKTHNKSQSKILGPTPVRGELWRYAGGNDTGDEFRVKWAGNTQRLWFRDEQGEVQYWSVEQGRWLLSKDGAGPVFGFARCEVQDGGEGEVEDEPEVESESDEDGEDEESGSAEGEEESSEEHSEEAGSAESEPSGSQTPPHFYSNEW